MEDIKKYGSFHDWYLMTVSADRSAGIVELGLMFDNKKDRVRVLFKGASRCLMNDFIIQNIIYEVTVLTDFESDKYKRALELLEKSYFGKENQPRKLIASVSATLGAELLIEFDTLHVFEVKQDMVYE